MSERIQNVKPKEWNGIKFRSTLEAQTAQALDAMGVPFQYEERKIVLQEGFRSPFQKDRIRAVTYIPDFIIGPIILECKGFETPEWKLKKKLVLKYLQENEPEAIFYQIHDSKKSLLAILDKHWPYLGLAVQVTSKGTKKKPSEVMVFDSIEEALSDLHLGNKPLGAILRSLTGTSNWVYGYNWKIIKNLT